MTRSSSRSLSVSTVLISSSTILPTGMPVQPTTTSATAWPSTTGMHQRRLALQLRQFAASSLARSSRAFARPRPASFGLRRRPSVGGAATWPSSFVRSSRIVGRPASSLRPAASPARPAASRRRPSSPSAPSSRSSWSVADGRLALQDADLDVERARSRGWQSSSARRRRRLAQGHAAQAVSSRLTDLSGSWRSVM